MKAEHKERVNKEQRQRMQQVARTMMKNSIDMRRSVYVNQTDEGGVATHVKMLYGLAQMTPMAMTLMVYVHGLMYFSTAGVDLSFMMLVMALLRSCDALWDPFIGWASDSLVPNDTNHRRDSDECYRRRAVIAIGCAVNSVSFAFLWRIEPYWSPGSLHTYYLIMYAIFFLSSSVVQVPLEAFGVELLDGYGEIKINKAGMPSFPEEHVSKKDPYTANRIGLQAWVNANRMAGCILGLAGPPMLLLWNRQFPPLAELRPFNNPIEARLQCKCGLPQLYNMTAIDPAFAAELKPYLSRQWVGPYSDANSGEQNDLSVFKSWGSVNATSNFRSSYKLYQPATCHNLTVGKLHPYSSTSLSPDLQSDISRWCAVKASCERDCSDTVRRTAYEWSASFLAVLHAMGTMLFIISVNENDSVVVEDLADKGADTASMQVQNSIHRPPIGDFMGSMVHFLRNQFAVPLAIGWAMDWLALLTFLVMVPFFIEYTVKPSQSKPWCDNGRRCFGINLCTAGAGGDAACCGGLEFEEEVWCTSVPWVAATYISFFLGSLLSGLLWSKLVTFLGPGTDMPNCTTNGKQLVWQRFSLVFCAAMGLFATFGRSDPRYCVLLAFFLGVPAGAMCLHYVVLADVIDYDEFFTGTRAEGRYAMLGSMLPKLMSVPAVCIPFGLMYLFGFEEPVEGRFIDEGWNRGSRQLGTLGASSENAILDAITVRWAMERWVQFIMGILPMVYSLVAWNFKADYPQQLAETSYTLLMGNALHLQGEAAVDPFTRKISIQLPFSQEEQQTHHVGDFKHLLPDQLRLLNLEHGDKMLSDSVDVNLLWAFCAFLVSLACALAFSVMFVTDRQMSWTSNLSLFTAGVVFIYLVFCYVQRHTAQKLIARKVHTKRADLLDRYLLNTDGIDAEQNMMETQRVNLILDRISDEFYLTYRFDPMNDPRDGGWAMQGVFQPLTRTPGGKRGKRGGDRGGDDPRQRFVASTEEECRAAMDVVVQDVMPLSDTLQGVATGNHVYKKRFRKFATADFNNRDMHEAVEVIQVSNSGDRHALTRNMDSAPDALAVPLAPANRLPLTTRMPSRTSIPCFRLIVRRLCLCMRSQGGQVCGNRWRHKPWVEWFAPKTAAVWQCHCRHAH
jgi:Na+/melibiose symporter-like transporter